ncbi:APC family permease [Myxococcus virescens]|uniref:Amino acid permease n=1 Tax=Myxococcus virescens TaxID=83456 RepID=A0A511HL93_9BACT|nr:APC family permease [Myxococcus virescens]GEL74351.1 amino acid permease [Myxococcus virescens]SDD23120.1 amino acid/polyamine/organocation transporter, APC superfamily (TC 2.A.3) [Myxococcus virescens]
MSLWRVLFGRPIPNERAEEERIGPLTGIPVLGLDALASAAYGPEAALTAMLVLGSAGPRYIGLLTGIIVALLLVVQFSYRQTIAAYPDGGGSFSVARANLGVKPALLAASALALDYVLNVAVAISAGVGALVSAVPSLFPHTLLLCLVLLGFIMVVNLRGVRTAGSAFLLPTYLFVGCLGITLLIGIWKVLTSNGSPVPVVAPPRLPESTAMASLWLLMHAFANGCTAMTGIEAVSNGVPIFREPRVRNARRTLLGIVSILVMLLCGVAWMSHAYDIGATAPGQAGYQSVLSQVVAAVTGRGVFYYVTLAAIVCVLCLSANTSFADFPRLCRALALDSNLPPAFAHVGQRLVYSTGIVTLSLLAAVLLVVFNGVTDHLIPLFAVGALSAFTLSQLGMVMHWRRMGGRGTRRFQWVNGVGAACTALALAVVATAKFEEGAWLTVVFIPLTYALLRTSRRHAERIHAATETPHPIPVQPLAAPVVVVPLRRLDRVAQKGLRLALSMSPDVYAVQVRGQPDAQEQLVQRWEWQVAAPLRKAGRPVPRLDVLVPTYRQVVDPLLGYVHKLAAEHPGRFIAVLVPELVERRWHHFIIPSHTATLLKMMLLVRGGPHIVVINTPWYLREPSSRKRRLRRGSSCGRPGSGRCSPAGGRLDSPARE